MSTGRWEGERENLLAKSSGVQRRLIAEWSKKNVILSVVKDLFTKGFPTLLVINY